MTDARTTCKQIKEQQKYDDLVNGAVDFVNNLWPPGKWIGNENKSKSQTTNITNMALTADDITKIINECNNNITTEQINKIVSGPECTKEYAELCKIFTDNESKMKCIKEMPKIQDINQSNLTTIKSNCVINQIIDKMTQQKPTIENVSKLLAIQQASGIGNTGKVLTSNCNEINQNINSTSLLEGVNNCVNKSIAKQKNILNVCGGAKINQSNVNDMIADCLLKSGVTTKIIVDPNIKNEDEKKNDQQMSNTVILAILGVIVGIVAIVGIYIAVKYYGAK